MLIIILWIVAGVGLIATYSLSSTRSGGNAVWGGATFGAIIGGIWSGVATDATPVLMAIPIGALVGIAAELMGAVSDRARDRS